MKQKISNFLNKFVAPFIFIGILGSCGYWLYQQEKHNRATQKPTHQEILYKKDSLEAEYYKMLLDTSYYFEHSKIPINESNTGIQSAR
jgi:hypothetical protein